MSIEYATTQAEHYTCWRPSELDRKRLASRGASLWSGEFAPIGPGTRIDGYRIIGELGRGGFGTVWHAADTDTGREVAIKVLRSELILNSTVVARFEREAKVVAMLDHDNVVDVHEFGERADGTPYLVMEYLVGVSLAAYLGRERALAPEMTLDILQQVGAALSAAHAHGVIHRDVKASNVMICYRPDGSLRAVLLDFGIAKLVEGHEPPITAPLATVGSPHFMAPEQICGQDIDPRADVYGLGILAFTLLTGELPFQGEMAVVLCAHIEDDRPAPSDRDESLRAFDGVIRRAMALHPDDRYSTVDEFLCALRHAVAHHRGAVADIDPSTRRVPAVGIHVQANIDIDAYTACPAKERAAGERAAMDDVDAALDRASRFLSRHGFLQAYEYGDSAVFALPITGTDASVERAARRRAIDIASQLRRHLAQRPRAHAWVAIGVHADAGAIELSGADDHDVAGGELLDWAPPSPRGAGNAVLTVSPALRRSARTTAEMSAVAIH